MNIDKSTTQLIVVQNRISPDTIVVVSLCETEQRRFIVIFTRESLTDRMEVIEEWFLKKGQHCQLEFEDNEIVALDDRLRLSLDHSAAEEGRLTCNTISIVGFQN